jgi:hypothetical protein
MYVPFLPPFLPSCPLFFPFSRLRLPEFLHDAERVRTRIYVPNILTRRFAAIGTGECSACRLGSLSVAWDTSPIVRIRAEEKKRMRLHCSWRQLAFLRSRRGAGANLATGRAFVRGVLSGEGVRQFSTQNTRCVIERARMEMGRDARTPRIRLPSRRDMC